MLHILVIQNRQIGQTPKSSLSIVYRILGSRQWDDGKGWVFFLSFSDIRIINILLISDYLYAITCEAKSKDKILIHVIQQVLTGLMSNVQTQIFGLNWFFFLPVLLLIIQHFLQPEEILTSLLVKFLFDILIDHDESRDNHMFQSIHTPIRHLDLLIECEEGSLSSFLFWYLKRSDINEQTENRSEFLSAYLNRMSTPFKADLTHCVIIVLKFTDSQAGNEHTCDIFLRLIQPDCWPFHSLQNFPPTLVRMYWNSPAAYLASAIKK